MLREANFLTERELIESLQEQKNKFKTSFVYPILDAAMRNYKTISIIWRIWKMFMGFCSLSRDFIKSMPTIGKWGYFNTRRQQRRERHEIKSFQALINSGIPEPNSRIWFGTNLPKLDNSIDWCLWLLLLLKAVSRNSILMNLLKNVWKI